MKTTTGNPTCNRNVYMYIVDIFIRSNDLIKVTAKKLNKTAHPWRALSPDLSILDFWFWGHMQQVVYENTNTIQICIIITHLEYITLTMRR